MLSFARLLYTTLLISVVYAAPPFPRAAANNPKTGAGNRLSIRNISCPLTLTGRLTILSRRDGCQPRQMDLEQVDQALGKTGVAMPDGIRRYSFPRTDLNVTLRGIHLKAGFALGGFAAFKLSGNTSVAMGDLVLTEDEINPVLSALQQGGIQQTDMHFKAQGDPVQVARTLHTALNLTKTPFTAPPNSTSPLGLDTTQLDAILGYHGKANNGVYQYSIPRAETITDGDMVIPPAMGVATAINFQPTEDDNAAITGDFTLIAKEVPLVLRTLSEQAITVTALHNHMLTDSPHLFYIHFWANDNALELAHGLRAALDQTNSKAST